MTKTNTITRAAALTTAIALLEREGMTAEMEVLGKMLASITKPRSNSGQPSKAAMENAKIAADVLRAMPAGEPVTGTWIGESVPSFPVGSKGVVSPQKVTAVMRLLVDAGKVSKAKVGKTMTYTLL